MRTTQQMRDLWGHNHKLVQFKFWTGVVVYIDSRMAEAVRALDAILKKWNYGPKKGQTWGHVDRKITAGSGISLHGIGIAIDINSLANPYSRTKLVTDMAFEMREEIERIRTKGGARVWRWGGDWDDDHRRNDPNYDAMHYEGQASPAELAAGIDWGTVAESVPDNIQEDDMQLILGTGPNKPVWIILPNGTRIIGGPWEEIAKAIQDRRAVLLPTTDAELAKVPVSSS